MKSLKNRMLRFYPLLASMAASFCLISPLCCSQILPTPGTVALTFDDGPSPYYTPKILKILDAYHVHATFFVTVSYAVRHTKVINEILAQGSVVANHSYTHADLSQMAPWDLDHEISVSAQVLERLTGETQVCFRPPYLKTNSMVREKVRDYGMHEVMGYSSDDYARPGVDKIVKRVVGAAKSRRIFIFHDGPAYRKQTVAALPLIIQGIYDKHLGISLICDPYH